MATAGDARLRIDFSLSSQQAPRIQAYDITKLSPSVNRADVIVRHARADELFAVQSLNSLAFENDAPHDEHLVMSWPFDADSGKKYFTDRINGNGGVCFIAERDGQVVGYLAGGCGDNESYRRGVRSELENMFVLDSARRFGVGKALVGAFEDWSRQAGASEIFVSAYFDNHRAVAFYKSQGFASWAHDLVKPL